MRGAATVEKVAIAAVMAGCLPDHLPVVVAAVRAVIEPAFDLTEMQAHHPLHRSAADRQRPGPPRLRRRPAASAPSAPATGPTPASAGPCGWR